MIKIKSNTSLKEIRDFLKDKIGEYEMYSDKNGLRLSLLDEEEGINWGGNEPILTIDSFGDMHFTGSGTQLDVRIIGIVYNLTKAGYIVND